MRTEGGGHKEDSSASYLPFVEDFLQPRFGPRRTTSTVDPGRRQFRYRTREESVWKPLLTAQVIRRKASQRMVQQDLARHLRIRHIPNEIDGFLVFRHIPETVACNDEELVAVVEACLGRVGVADDELLDGGVTESTGDGEDAWGRKTVDQT